MVPTLCRALGVKGHRPAVGTRDCKHLVYVFAVVNVATAAIHANLVEGPKDAARKTGKSKARRLQEASAAQLRHVGRTYPGSEDKRVVVLIDNAPWHAGAVVAEALADHPHLELKRLPIQSPQLNVIERFWKLLRRRATRNRLCDTVADLKRPLRASLCYYQTVRGRIQSLVAGCYTPPKKQTASAGL